MASLQGSSSLVWVVEKLEYDGSREKERYAEGEDNPNLKELDDSRCKNGRDGDYQAFCEEVYAVAQSSGRRWCYVSYYRVHGRP